jgi:alpha-ketoglutarate-dependent taurine dioxygenase
MKKLVCLSLLLLLILCSCSSTAPEEEIEIPVWLKLKTEEMNQKPFYAMSTLHRYKWHYDYIYEFTIPVSSCIYCEVYKHTGEKIKFDDITISDYNASKTEGKLIWNWGEKL